MIKLVYIANIRMPTSRAHGIQVVKMCEAFAKNQADVFFIVPRLKNITGKDLWSYYGVKQKFKVIYLPVINLLFLGLLGFALRELTFAISVLTFGRKYWKNADIVFSRSILAIYVLSFFRKNIFFEMHDWPIRFHPIWKFLISRMTGIVSTNKWKAEKLRADFLIPADRILVFPNGFDPKLFDIKESREELRKLLNLPQDKPIAMYTGHLYSWKGAYVMAEAAKFASDINFVFVGGTDEDAEEFKKKYESVKNIILVGHKPYADIPKYLKSADALILPNSAKTEESRYATSPIKLFEYMASGIPIVASDLPSIREVVSEHEIFFVVPDSAENLLMCIKSVFREKNRAAEVSESARLKSQKYSWNERAEAILNLTKRLIKVNIS